MWTKKTLAILISLSLLACSLIACSSADSGGADTTAAGDPSTPEADGTTASDDITTYLEPMDSRLAALDYGGKQVTVLARTIEDEPTSWANWAGAVELIADELTNDPINDSIYNRTMKINEDLGVELKLINENLDKINEKVGVMVNSGDQTYDIVAASVIDGTPMVTQGYVLNLYDNGIETYLDPSNVWWAQLWIKEAQLGDDSLYSITGAPCLSLSRLMFVTYYNKDLGEDEKVEDLYNVVEEGRWTMDYVSQLIPSLYKSLNGDDERDEEDQYGLAINHYENCDMFWSSCNMSLLAKDEDGWFEFTAQDKEKISNVYDKLYALLYNNTGTYDFQGSAGFDVARDMFANGNVLLAMLHLRYAESEQFRNMQDEYGILPISKYDEAQKDYYTYVHDQYSILMVPKTVESPERCGAVMEALAYESYKEVQPVYFDVVLKGRYANDPQSRRMIDMISQNIKIDAAWIYGRMLSMPCDTVLRGPIGSKSTSFATHFAKVQSQLPVYIKAFKATMEKIGETN